MSGVLATTTVASCSTPSRTLCAASSGGLRPSLTAPAHNALASSDRNEETPRFNQTKKHHRQKPKPLLHSLTDTTANAARRHHLPKQNRKMTNWAVYDASLRQHASLTVWFSDDAIAGWKAEPRTTRG